MESTFLDPFFKAKDEYTAYISSKPMSRTRDAILYALEGQGKLVRPKLTILSAQIFAAQQSDHRYMELVGQASLALELVHTYSLIHDDLPCMDDDDIRRGRPTLHKKFSEHTALLAGDALLTDAFFVLSKTNANPDQIVRSIQTLSKSAGSLGMIEGQTLDLDNTGKTVANPQELVCKMHLLKTGELLGASLALGAIAANASIELEAAMYHFGLQIGLAYQIADDLLDQRNGIGKTEGKDLAQGKITFATTSHENLEHLVQTITEKAAKDLADSISQFPYDKESLSRLLRFTNSLITREK